MGDVTDSRAVDISALLGKCRSATIFHSLEWNRVLSSELDLEPVVSLVLSGGGAVGCNVFYRRWGSVGLKTSWSPPRMYDSVYGGPVFLDGFEDAAHVLLAEQERRSGAHTTYVVTPPGFDAGLLRRAGYSVVMAETVVLDLGRSEDDLWKGLGPKRRNMIRRAEREGVHVRAGSEADVVHYHDLLRDTLARSGREALPLSLFRRVVRELVPASAASFLIATCKEKIVAGALLLHWGSTSVYWSGAS
ncbi:MAG: GNAT family N-acetyltransferase, partial [Candidatus Eiseniibacteriota bacterium]